MIQKTGIGLVVAALVVGLAAAPALAGKHKPRKHDAGKHEPGKHGAGKHERERELPSSPYIVGTWKLVPNEGQPPSVDTEFRFINPTNVAATLEYAFFELDGTFCGCDRDNFNPNQTTIYTMLAESQLPPPLPGGPAVFSCKGTSGALKSIVFRTEGDKLILRGATQVGFQLKAFGDLVETDTTLQGRVMTEATMASVPLDAATREEIRKIHALCVTVNGPVQ